MEKAEYEKIVKAADQLQDSIDRRTSIDVAKAQEYSKGYKDGIESLLDRIRRGEPEEW